MIDFKEIRVPNPGILILDLPKELFSSLKEQVNIQILDKSKFQKQLRKSNQNLAGHIQEEYNFINTKEFDEFLKELAHNYYEHFNLGRVKEITEIDSWVNLQKKTEYNPLHEHFGSLSWVVWVSNPYKLKDEDSLPSSINANVKANGRFEFVYSEMTGRIKQYHINLDSSYEGKLVIFSSSLLHQVYPFFTSDENRISLAGNIFLSFTK